MMEKWHRIDAATGRPVEVVMGARREGKTAKMCQDAYKAGLLRAAELAEEWADSEDGESPNAGGAMMRFVDGPDALRRLAARLRQEAGGG